MSVELIVDNSKNPGDKQPPQQSLAMEMPVAKIRGEFITEMPVDLFIPPDALSVVLEQFEGPLDLLLYLIRKHSLDILDIPMADLTRQYMTYVEAMRDGQLELAAEYLLMAALLIEIKSRMLLPRPPREDEHEAEDPRAELVRRLLEYEQMKAAANALDHLPRKGRDFSIVDVLVEQSLVKRVPTVLAADLTDAWRAILARAKNTQKHRVSREELSVRSHMSRILRFLGEQTHEGGFVNFETLFKPEEGVSVVVVSFLAVLELARESLIEITQTAPLEPIYVKIRTAEMPPLV
jgi:segregation and condensation protein A